MLFLVWSWIHHPILYHQLCSDNGYLLSLSLCQFFFFLKLLEVKKRELVIHFVIIYTDIMTLGIVLHMQTPCVYCISIEKIQIKKQKIAKKYCVGLNQKLTLPECASLIFHSEFIYLFKKFSTFFLSTLYLACSVPPHSFFESLYCIFLYVTS